MERPTSQFAKGSGAQSDFATVSEDSYSGTRHEEKPEAAERAHTLLMTGMSWRLRVSSTCTVSRLH